jgi:hypothetical protein
MRQLFNLAARTNLREEWKASLGLQFPGARYVHDVNWLDPSPGPRRNKKWLRTNKYVASSVPSKRSSTEILVKPALRKPEPTLLQKNSLKRFRLNNYVKWWRQDTLKLRKLHQTSRNLHIQLNRQTILQPQGRLGTELNPLNPSGYYVQRHVSHKRTLHFDYPWYLFVRYLYYHKQQLLPYTRRHYWPF